MVENTKYNVRVALDTRLPCIESVIATGLPLVLAGMKSMMLDILRLRHFRISNEPGEVVVNGNAADSLILFTDRIVSTILHELHKVYELLLSWTEDIQASSWSLASKRRSARIIVSIQGVRDNNTHTSI